MKKRLLVSLLLIILGSVVVYHFTSANLDGGTIRRVSVASDGAEGNSWSNYPSISADGRYIAFVSRSNNLVDGDANVLCGGELEPWECLDIFVHDQLTGETTLVSVASDGTQGNGDSVAPMISATGRYVGFISKADNLVMGDTNDAIDTFIHDRLTGETVRVSVASDGTQGNDDSVSDPSTDALAPYPPPMSADGRLVAFSSRAGNLVDGDMNNGVDIFVRDRLFGQTTLVSVASDGSQAEVQPYSIGQAISADGRFVAFVSKAADLVSGDSNTCAFSVGCHDVFVHDRLTGQTILVSQDESGMVGNDRSGAGVNPSISGDGRFVAFHSWASNLVPGDTNDNLDVFVHDQLTGEIALVSVSSDGTQGNRSSRLPAISADGRFIVFLSWADNLVAGDTNDSKDVFLHDRLTGETTLISVAFDGTQAVNDLGLVWTAIAADGKTVGFSAFADNLVPEDTNEATDVFIQSNTVSPPRLASSAPSGKPGSFFTISASGFPPTSTLRLEANGQPLGDIAIDPDGSATAELDSALASSGLYVVTARSGQFAAGQLTISLDPAGPLLPQTGGLPVLDLPANTAFSETTFIPSAPHYFGEFDPDYTSSDLVLYDSGFRLQNLSSEEARFQISFIEPSGELSFSMVDSLEPSGLVSYFPLSEMNGPFSGPTAGFNGSVVVNSDQPLVATVNVVGSNGQGDPLAFSDSYAGLSTGAPTIQIPLLMKANYGYNTWFSVQNLGLEATDITVSFSNGSTETVVAVQPGAAAHFDQATNPGLPSGFVGSASVSSSSAQPLAAAVFEVGPDTLFAYTSFDQGAVMPAIPLMQQNHFGYVSGAQIQNFGTVSTTVSVQYTPSEEWPGTACLETRVIQPMSSETFGLYVFTGFADPHPESLLQNTCTLGESFVGSAHVIENSAGARLAAIVNQLNISESKGAASKSLDPAAATDTLILPLVMDRYYGYFTGINIENIGSSDLAPDTVVCEFRGHSAQGSVVVDLTAPAIPVGESWKLVNAPDHNGEIADGFVGTGICTAPPGSQLISTVNQVNLMYLKDTFMTYEGINLP